MHRSYDYPATEEETETKNIFHHSNNPSEEKEASDSVPSSDFNDIGPKQNTTSNKAASVILSSDSDGTGNNFQLPVERLNVNLCS